MRAVLAGLLLIAVGSPGEAADPPACPDLKVAARLAATAVVERLYVTEGIAEETVRVRAVNPGTARRAAELLGARLTEHGYRIVDANHPAPAIELLVANPARADGEALEIAWLRPPGPPMSVPYAMRPGISPSRPSRGRVAPEPAAAVARLLAGRGWMRLGALALAVLLLGCLHVWADGKTRGFLRAPLRLATSAALALLVLAFWIL